MDIFFKTITILSTLKRIDYMYYFQSLWINFSYKYKRDSNYKLGIRISAGQS